jgi:hypothetical protein
MLTAIAISLTASLLFYAIVSAPEIAGRKRKDSSQRDKR